MGWTSDAIETLDQVFHIANVIEACGWFWLAWGCVAAAVGVVVFAAVRWQDDLRQAKRQQEWRAAHTCFLCRSVDKLAHTDFRLHHVRPSLVICRRCYDRDVRYPGAAYVIYERSVAPGQPNYMFLFPVKPFEVGDPMDRTIPWTEYQASGRQRVEPSQQQSAASHARGGGSVSQLDAAVSALQKLEVEDEAEAPGRSESYNPFGAIVRS